ncbi:uncharacterized protein LOC132926535 [Rhopalosiphum padi]|uniref:uncharacterized protein LOC132926535 n=1 Tax=Rhopalosiphum padi TaxID=40932 RepID=UPI00298DDDD4|nr:uncharacterized protein LOC132926535 [Rhopalosiphum padi]XP_060846878.1 uncharacterized protein LOC132926535 [Rhopalosiphum padi]
MKLSAIILFLLVLDHIQHRSVKIPCQKNWNIQDIKKFKNNNSLTFIDDYGACGIQRLVMIQSQIFSEENFSIMLEWMNEKLKRYAMRSCSWEQSDHEIYNDHFKTNSEVDETILMSNLKITITILQQ